MVNCDKILISDDIKNVKFACNLAKCKGNCCVYGDAGAPLEESEVSYIEDHKDIISKYMRKEGIEIMEKDGVFYMDEEDEMLTPLVNNAECIYAIFEDGIAKCAIEKAFENGELEFQKPISCHLYPLRIVEKEDFIAINYHEWDICKSALSKRKGEPLYKYLKVPLTRKFGEEWYQALADLFEK